MITGQISTDREAIIPVPVLDFNGQQTEVEAIIDTGFTDFLRVCIKRSVFAYREV